MKKYDWFSRIMSMVMVILGVINAATGNFIASGCFWISASIFYLASIINEKEVKCK